MRERVFSLLICRLTSGVPKLSEIASALALSERTLSRRLADEGTSIRELADSARAAMAEALMDDPALSLTEISYLLGFADQSSFTHAYKRWTGEAPVQVRRRKQTTAS